MTDKQIIIDGVDVSGCSLYEDNPKYRMWGTCDCMRSMVDQSGYDELAGAECKGYNCYYKQLKRKEQECEELKNDNHTLLVTRQKLLNDLWIAEESLKDFKEICDKQCEQLEAYKMEAEEGKEINAELKTENDNLKSLIWWIHIGAEGADKATTEYYENRNTPYEENYWKRIRALQPPTYESKYKLALTEIKEIAEDFYLDGEHVKDKYLAQEILQKISEVEDENNRKI